MSRWSGREGLDLAVDAVAWLAGWSSAPPTELVRDDGWVDVSGLDFVGAALERERRGGGNPHPEVTIKVEGRSWYRVDFTGAKMVGVIFENMTIDECVFDKADLRDSRWAACAVTGSRFHGANLRRARLSLRWYDTAPPSRWEDCSFDDSHYVLDGLDYTEFIRCRLHFATWRDVRYVNCKFVDCSFAGPMNRVQFDSRDFGGTARPNWKKERIFRTTFDHCDFSEARFVDVGFYGCTFVKPLWNPQSWILEVPMYGKALKRLEAVARAAHTEGARWVGVFLEPIFKIPPRPESTWIFNLTGMQDEPDAVIGEFVDVFIETSKKLRLPPPVVHGSRP